MFKKLLSSQLRINMASGVITTVINTVVMAAGYPIYLHYLGYEKYGLWLVLSVVLTFAQLGNLGIGPAVIKLVAEEYGRDNMEGIQHYVTTALALLCLSGLVVLIMILLFKSRIIAAFKLSDADAEVVASLVPYIGILSIYVFVVQVLDATLSGLGRMDLANYIQALARLFSVCIVAILLYKGFGILSLLIGNTVSYIFNHLVSLFYIRRIAQLRLLQVTNFDTHRCKRLLRFGGGIFASSMISMLFSPFNKLMLSRYAGVATIPIYEIAYTGSMQVRGLIEAGLRPLMPEISRLNGMTTQEARDRIIQIYRRAIRLILSAGIPIYATLTLAAPVLLKLWLRDRFIDTLPNAFRIMLIGSFVGLFVVPAYYTLMGMGHIRYNLGAHIVQAGVNLIIAISVLIISEVTITTIVGASTIAMVAVSLYLLLQMRSVFQRFGQGQSQMSELW